MAHFNQMVRISAYKHRQPPSRAPGSIPSSTSQLELTVSSIWPVLSEKILEVIILSHSCSWIPLSGYLHPSAFPRAFLVLFLIAYCLFLLFLNRTSYWSSEIWSEQSFCPIKSLGWISFLINHGCRFGGRDTLSFFSLRILSLSV